MTLNILNDWWPIATDPQSDLVKLALKAASDSYANQPELTIINGATDASVFVKHRADLPVVVLGADEWSRAHQIDEYTTWSSYLPRLMPTVPSCMISWLAKRLEDLHVGS